jgi:hypothetical protein
MHSSSCSASLSLFTPSKIRNVVLSLILLFHVSGNFLDSAMAGNQSSSPSTMRAEALNPLAVELREAIRIDNPGLIEYLPQNPGSASISFPSTGRISIRFPGDSSFLQFDLMSFRVKPDLYLRAVVRGLQQRNESLQIAVEESGHVWGYDSVGKKHPVAFIDPPKVVRAWKQGQRIPTDPFLKNPGVHLEVYCFDGEVYSDVSGELGSFDQERLFCYYQDNSSKRLVFNFFAGRPATTADSFRNKQDDLIRVSPTGVDEEPISATWFKRSGKYYLILIIALASAITGFSAYLLIRVIRNLTQDETTRSSPLDKSTIAQTENASPPN